MFFKQFPKLAYKIDDSLITITDIFRRVIPLEKFIVNESFLEQYTIKAGERPEDIAFTLYGDPQYHWILLLINNIIDPYNEWYYTSDQIKAMVNQRYGEAQSNATHHWATSARPEICVDYDPDKVASGEIFEVTHLEHEEIENELRQTIRVLHPRYLNDFVAEFKQLIGR